MNKQEAWDLIVHGWIYNGKAWIDSPTLNNFVKRILYTKPDTGQYSDPDPDGRNMQRHEIGFISHGILKIYRDKAVDSNRIVNWFVDPANLGAFSEVHPNAEERI